MLRLAARAAPNSYQLPHSLAAEHVASQHGQAPRRRGARAGTNEEISAGDQRSASLPRL